MARIVALYNTPKDPAAFDAYYETKHVVMARRMPGVRSIELSNGQIMTPGGASSYHRVGTLRFDSWEALQTALASPEGQATAADVMTFATGGVTLLFFDTLDV